MKTSGLLLSPVEEGLLEAVLKPLEEAVSPDMLELLDMVVRGGMVIEERVGRG
jgi:hypothetical protein